MKIKVNFTEPICTLGAHFNEITQTLGANFGEIQQVTEFIGGEEYEGEYVAIPKTKEQIFETKGMVMTENITIKPIPFFEVSNSSGGSTVYIGSEV